ncbi:MAG: DNA recombination protein RmuC [Paludibacteraceae bacterium]|nr:DNA recombination protein RmuC [Paludibacteraceae bacterium]
MSNITFLLIGLALGVIIVFIVYRILSKHLTETKQQLEQKQNELQENIKISAEYKSKNDALQEKLDSQKEEIERIRVDLNKEFRLMAGEIMEEKTKSFSEMNAEKIGNILDPLKEKIQLFEKKVEETYNNETREKESLRKELEQIVKANSKISDDAQKLTLALKGDSKLQGDWGEMQLETLLEKSGLQKGIHYLCQPNYKTDENTNVRPDFIINLPDNKNFIIDSKVSLTAYERYFNAEDDNQRKIALNEHLQSINKHIQELSGKNYPSLYGINSPDYVFLYVAVEPALNLALQNDLELFEKAMRKNIVLVSATTLLATMRTVSFIWRQENQKNNVIAIATESGKLYDKFVGFLEDMAKIGKSLDASSTSFHNAMNKLSESSKYGDTILGRMENIKKLGANTQKKISDVIIEGE